MFVIIIILITYLSKSFLQIPMKLFMIYFLNKSEWVPVSSKHRINIIIILPYPNPIRKNMTIIPSFIISMQRMILILCWQWFSSQQNRNNFLEQEFVISSFDTFLVRFLNLPESCSLYITKPPDSSSYSPMYRSS